MEALKIGGNTARLPQQLRRVAARQAGGGGGDGGGEPAAAGPNLPLPRIGIVF